MFANYVRVAVRNLFKHKSQAFLNIAGLAIGIASAIIILLYVGDEFSYDRFHKHADRIYRMNLSGNWLGDEVNSSTTPPPLADMMLTEFPEVAAATRIFPPGAQVVRHGSDSFTEQSILAVDSCFFDVFSFRLLEGNPATLLNERNNLVLTEQTAYKYFGEAGVMGKTLLIGDEREAFTITGIVADPPRNSHFDFDMLTSTAAYPVVKRFDWSWIWMQMVTYVRLQDNASVAALQAKIPAMVKKHGQKVIERFSGMSFEQFERNGGQWNFVLQPLTDIRLHSQQYGNRLGSIGSIQTVYLLSGIALIIIVIASINFVNLFTARSANRAKEIGIRKVAGSNKQSLVVQFILESLLYSIVATLLALGTVELVLGSFSSLAGKSLALDFFDQAWLFFGVIILALAVGLMSGIYPAFYLTSFRPVEVLKGKLSGGKKKGKFRNTLVVIQFALSIGLLVCTFLVYDQLRFISEKDLGFNKKNILVISNTERLGNQEQTFKQSIVNLSQVQSASFASGLPAGNSFGDFYEPEASDIRNFLLNSIKGDSDLLETLGIRLVAGRNFRKNYPADQQSVLLNDAAVRRLGWDQPLGKTLVYPGHDHQKLEVIGVVEDFHFFSLYQNIQPFGIFLFESDTYTLPTNYLAVRLRQGGMQQALERIEDIWRSFALDTPLEFSFLADDIDKQFSSAQRFGKVLTLFSALAVVVGCIGLFGLATFSAEQRTKEFGIRKVLGASPAALAFHLAGEFSKLVVVANLLAWPAAYFMMQRWLQNFAYRIDIDVLPFLLAASLALAVALLTVSLQASKAALANPVRALRYE